jgi:hypothetical protein
MKISPNTRFSRGIFVEGLFSLMTTLKNAIGKELKKCVFYHQDDTIK